MPPLTTVGHRNGEEWHLYFTLLRAYFKIMASLIYFSPGCQNEGEGGVNGKDYEGNEAKTVSGLECQKWSEQKPHKHRFSDIGDHNFCRNPDEHKGVWCYTTDKNRRWEACDVPECDIGQFL